MTRTQAVLGLAILSLALALSRARAADEPAAAVTPAATVEAMKKDLEGRPKADRPFLRYFTLGHLAGGAARQTSPRDDLALHRGALSKLVNSLSWKKAIVAPRAVDDSKTLVAIDLRDYGWDAKTWEAIAALHPYGLVPATDAAKACATETGCEVPCVRGDWFLKAGSSAPLYATILGLPATEDELEKAAGVNVRADVAQRTATRAAIHASGESDENRVLERHRSQNGAYWKTYDFRDSDNKRNVFVNPLGPGKGEFDFEHDGSEVIFALPNGLLGFAIFDEKGARKDEAPITTAWNKEAGAGSIRIAGAASCMGCHTRGLRADHPDQLRRWYDWHAALDPKLFAKPLLEGVRAFYVDQSDWERVLQGDVESYRAAVEKAGLTLSDEDPVASLAARFGEPVDRKLAAAELGLDEDAFAEKQKAAPVLELAPLSDGKGRISRAAFARAFPLACASFQLGACAKVEGAAAPEDAPEPGLARYEIPLGDGVLSVDGAPAWLTKRFRAGLGLEPAGGTISIDLATAKTAVTDLARVLQSEKAALAERFQESSTGARGPFDQALTVKARGESAGDDEIACLAIAEGNLVRIAARYRHDRQAEALAIFEKTVATARVRKGGLPLRSPLPDKLREAGFESDWETALSRARAEGKLVVAFLRPVTWWYT